MSRRRLLPALAIAGAAVFTSLPAPAQVGTLGAVPIALPERPFLLVDAPERVVPGQPATVRIQLRGGGRLSVALFRVHDPEALLGQAGRREGLSVARTPLGQVAEQLVAAAPAPTSRPRRGAGLTLLRLERLTMPPPASPRDVSDEAEVYDSNDEEDVVATSWVRRDRWSSLEHRITGLPAGLYLVCVHAGPWATSTLVSVGRLVLLARRGDLHDTVLVTDEDGAPVAGVEVEARALGDGGARRRARTDARGEARFPPSPQLGVRFVVRQGDDLAWADVTHTNLAPCDPRVYLATGRPVYRPGETMYLRGHVRGCDASGDFVGLAGEVLRLGSTGGGEAPVEVRTDGDGNFVAELPAPAAGEIYAEHRGRAHRRGVTIDSRSLPRRSLFLEIDRPWAAAHQLVQVRVADEDGGWPRRREVVLRSPAGRLVAPIGPGRPATFLVPVPATDAPIERLTLTASLTDGARTTFAAGELWIGRHPTLLEVSAPVERARAGETLTVTVSATDLGGAAAPGDVVVALHESDGNERLGARHWQGTVSIDESGRRSLQIPLSGRGPWAVVARRGEARGRVTVWGRPRPPALARRGGLTVVPGQRRVEPGQRLTLRARLPGGSGRTWITLEQGGVHASRLLPPGPERLASVTIPVPRRARGLASIVATHVQSGRVRTATATVEVATSRELALVLDTDRRIYAEGEDATVTLAARDADGRPADAVISLWLADAGYWDLGPERYPLPGEYLRLPGRAASAGDSATILAYGAEEGRVLEDARMEWDGQRVDGATYRHAWRYGGELIDLTIEGRLAQIADHLARRAGFRGGRMCADDGRRERRGALLVRALPWDLVAMELARLTDTAPRVDGALLRFECGGFGGLGLGTIGHGGGGGSGMGYGSGTAALTREQRLEGTLHFVGLQRLGPDGRLVLTVPMPDHPGRWRVEALAIADDGGGARAHRVVRTDRPLRGWIELARRARQGDEVRGELRVLSPSLAGREVELRLQTDERLSILEAPPSTVTLDAGGRASAPIRLRALTPGEATLRLQVAAPGAANDVSTRLEVLGESTAVPVSLRAILGADAREIHLTLPELRRAATLHVQSDRRLDPSIADVLEALRRPRWDVAPMRIDRLATLDALDRAAEDLPSCERTRRLRRELTRTRRAEAAALARMQTAAGGASAWRGLPPDVRWTALALYALGDLADDPRWRGAWTRLRRAARRRPDEMTASTRALVALLLTGRDTEDDLELARSLLPDPGSLPSLAEQIDALGWTVRAANQLVEEELRDAAAARLAAEVRARLEGGASSPAACRGPAWFLCYARWGDRGEVARAALALLDVEHESARELASDALRWLAVQPPAQGWWVWGTDEADVLALLATRTRDDGAAEPFTYLVDGRPARPTGSRLELPAGARHVTIRFPARPGRLRPLRVDGELVTAPPPAPLGTLGLERRFLRHADGGWSLELSLSLPRRADEVEVVVPVPAGLDPAPAAHVAGARATFTDEGLELRWPRLPRGSTRVSLPLIVTGRGSFGVGPARARTRDAALWALTPAARVQVD